MQDLAKRSEFVLNILQEIYPTVTIPLQYTSAFSLLVAVILSAQCTDERVNQVTPKLFVLASTPEEMGSLSLGKIEQIIHPCGLFRTKARSIQLCSQMICGKFSGKIPQTFEELEQLPGVGHKTASVIISQYFHGYAFPVDTHIRRLANRWQLVKSNNVVVIEKTLKSIFPEETWHDLHIRMIRFGREYCPARKHITANCPICKTLATVNSNFM